MLRPAPLIALLSCVSLPAQHVAGHVLGFDGAPVRGAVVRVFGGGGERLVELLTDAGGRFTYDARLPLRCVTVQLEGVHKELAVTGGTAVGLHCSFAEARFFTLRGHVVDPIGEPMPEVDLRIADADGGTVCTATTTSKGAFLVRVDEPVEAIVVDPVGLAFVHHGSFDSDRGIAIDLRLARDRFFCVAGRVLGRDGAPLPGAIVGAGDGSALLRRPTHADGSFRLWSERPLSWLEASVDGEPVALVAQAMAADCEVEIDIRRHGRVRLTGQVVDGRGAGRPYVALFCADAAGDFLLGLPMLGRTGADGSFAVDMPRGVPRLLVYRDRQRNGAVAWTADGPLKVTLR
ncbi:MAG: carboxypeptidase regulatory-like domain-containing protein [Planctomycetes bacterium]|nr:carboxypeptidase regulatory-like domain-containing protein [Planctomycetota bacterium]